MTSIPQTPSTLVDELEKKADVAGVQTVRNTFLAGAALSTTIIISLTQLGAAKGPLQIAVVGSVIALPFFSSLAFVLECYLALGKDYFAHLNSFRKSGLYTALQAIAFIGLYLALCGVIYFLMPSAVVAFVGASVAAVTVICVIFSRLAIWRASVNRNGVK